MNKNKAFLVKPNERLSSYIDKLTEIITQQQDKAEEEKEEIKQSSQLNQLETSQPEQPQYEDKLASEIESFKAVFFEEEESIL